MAFYCYCSRMRDWLYLVTEGLLTPVVRYLFRFDVEGVDRIPKDGPVLLASNHLSPFDPIVYGKVGLNLKPKRYPRFMAKAELFQKQPLSWCLGKMHQIPVYRGQRSVRESMDAARAALTEGEFAIIFPEGTISPLFVPMKPHSGVGRLARDTGVPVVPAGLWGTQRVWPGYRSQRDFSPRHPLTITFGAPVRYASTDRPAVVARDIMSRVVECVEVSRERYPRSENEDPWWEVEKWPTARAGHWRPKAISGMKDEEVLAAAHEALYGEIGRSALEGE